jgi:catechol 2,3-dioxygenase-like lactoylglutathione lyase family enzyme
VQSRLFQDTQKCRISSPGRSAADFRCRRSGARGSDAVEQWVEADEARQDGASPLNPVLGRRKRGDYGLPDLKSRTLSAVPVFRVASVARSAAWYTEVLGFTPDSVGPPAEPVFSILRRGGVELMLQKVQGAIAEPRAAGPSAGWDLYLRVEDVAVFRTALQAKVQNIGPIMVREYGCSELTLNDPDGHVIVLGQCG